LGVLGGGVVGGGWGVGWGKGGGGGRGGGGAGGGGGGGGERETDIAQTVCSYLFKVFGGGKRSRLGRWERENAPVARPGCRSRQSFGCGWMQERSGVGCGRACGCRRWRGLRRPVAVGPKKRAVESAPVTWSAMRAIGVGAAAVWGVGCGQVWRHGERAARGVAGWDGRGGVGARKHGVHGLWVAGGGVRRAGGPRWGMLRALTRWGGVCNMEWQRCGRPATAYGGPSCCVAAAFLV